MIILDSGWFIPAITSNTTVVRSLICSYQCQYLIDYKYENVNCYNYVTCMSVKK